MIFDKPRLEAPSSDNNFTLTVEDALSCYADAGIQRTPRSIQRYCAKEHLACRLIETEFGEKYLINPTSVEKHIAYIKEVTPTTSRGATRQVSTTVAPENGENAPGQSATTAIDEPRPVAASPDLSRYVARLEGDVDFLRNQLEVKDTQIKEMTERARETNVLIGGLQKMLSPLLNPGWRAQDDGREVGNNN